MHLGSSTETDTGQKRKGGGDMSPQRGDKKHIKAEEEER